MEIISVKIERTYLSFSRERYERGVCTVLVSRRVYLPQALRGEKGRSHPDGLAKILHESLKDGAISGKNLALYLGAKTAFFASYKYGSGLDEAAKEKRRRGEEESLFEHLKEKPLSAFYEFGSEADGLASGGIIASDAGFVKALTTELQNYGYTITLVSSSLVGYAEALRPLVRGAGRVLALDADKTGLKAVRFEDGAPVFLAEYEFAETVSDAQATEQAIAQTTARATKLIGSKPVSDFGSDSGPDSKAKSKIVITGFLSGDPNLAGALAALPGVTYCQPLSFDLKGVKKSMAFDGNLTGREPLLPGIFSAVGADPRDPYLPDLIRAKAKEEKKKNKGLVALCIVSLLVAVAACAVPPFNMIRAQYELNENRAVFLNEGNAQAQEKLAERRDLISMQTELKVSQNLLPPEAVSYASVIEELKIGLLMNAELQEISFAEGTGLLLDLTTDDVKNFDEMKTLAESSGRMQILEPVAREEIPVGKNTITHIKIRILAGNELR
jgi:hypothetical protein